VSAWKRTALEKLPECRTLIESSDSPMALWIELHLRFERLNDDDFTRRIFEYARWCVESPGDGGHLSDAGTAAVCAFYEHLPQQAAIRRDLSRWLTREEFTNLREAFRYHLSEQEFLEFEKDFLDRTKKGLRK
jgi:hypothetical protein